MKALVKLVGCGFALVVVVSLFEHVPLGNKMVGELWGLNQLHYFEFRKKLKARLLPAIDGRFAFANNGTPSSQPQASLPSGFYDRPVHLYLAVPDERADIFYTLDGSIPTQHSLRYREPIEVRSTTVVRFRSFRSGYLPSDTATRTYFIQSAFKLPVVSIVTDPVQLWSRNSGIYRNAKKRGPKWERPAEVEHFPEMRSPAVAFPTKLRIHGGYSRNYEKKSFRLTYQPEGLRRVEGDQIITRPGTAQERSVVLRAGGSIVWSTLRDELFQSLVTETGGLSSRFEPCLLFLNGEPWGIYYLRERIDEEYLFRMAGSGPYDLIRDNSKSLLGDAKSWEQMLSFFGSADLSNEEEFKKAAEMIDVANFTDYWLLNIYGGSVDWPHWNTYAFSRRNGHDRRWRWISWDADDSFQGRVLAHNTLAWAIRDKLRHDLRIGKGKKDYERLLSSTLIVRSLLANASYKERFITRFCDLLNSYLIPERVEERVDTLIAAFRPELEKDWRRWSVAEEQYWSNIEEIRHFIRSRPDIIRAYFQKEFKLGPLLEIEVYADSSAGGVEINGIEVGKSPWVGKYFAHSRITLKATPRPGYKFVRWTAPSLGSSPEITLELKDSMRVEAIYRRNSPPVGKNLS